MTDLNTLFPLTDERDGRRVHQRVILVNKDVGGSGYKGKVQAIDADPAMPHPFHSELLMRTSTFITRDIYVQFPLEYNLTQLTD